MRRGIIYREGKEVAKGRKEKMSLVDGLLGEIGFADMLFKVHGLVEDTGN